MRTGWNETTTDVQNQKRKTVQNEGQQQSAIARQYQLAGAGGIEPCNNPLSHEDFFIPIRPFDSIFDSEDEVAYIEAKGWKASVVVELSIIDHFANFCGYTPEL